MQFAICIYLLEEGVNYSKTQVVSYEVEEKKNHKTVKSNEEHPWQTGIANLPSPFIQSRRPNARRGESLQQDISTMTKRGESRGL